MPSMFRNSYNLKVLFWLAAIIYIGQSNFEYKYLGEFPTEFENILGYESGDHEGSIDEKKSEVKISCYCPFKTDNLIRDSDTSSS
jgi:hypothetical protein